MNAEQLRAWLLTKPGFAYFKEVISDHYSWLIHDAPSDRLDSIRQTGLVPSSTCSNFPEIEKEILPAPKGIVCLSPIGSAGQPGSSSAGSIFRLGLHVNDLPALSGLDYSFPESWTLRSLTETQVQQYGADGAILYVVQGTGSVASYLPVQSSLLRVCTKGKQGQFPSTWPMLADTPTELIQFT